jgi:hypothetical protein
LNILFDIVIPVGPNDINKIENMIQYTKKNIIGFRNIYIISKNETRINDCIFINENIFPFNINDISNYLGKNERNGWYLQQLLKLYVSFVVKDILNNYLIIDADTFFLKPTFFFKNQLPLYNTGVEFHLPYFEHMRNLHPSLIKQNNKSGICHHMMFQKNILEELFNMIESYHNNEFWKCFLNVVNKNEILGSGASEYEIYFNYLHIYHKNKFIIRDLNWTNTSSIPEESNYDYISSHWYL